MKIPFAKMSGAGNDFVVIDNRSGKVKDGSRLARRICDRKWGVGADGLILLENSAEAEYRMMYYNADGSYGGMCGNGGRCIARFAVDKGLAGSVHRFEALGYIYDSIVKPDVVLLTMKDPVRMKMGIVLPLGSSKLKLHFVDTGSPHVVIPIAQLVKRYRTLEAIPVTTIGRKIRYHKSFSPEGTNVNFIERTKAGSIRIRTYERGVEEETLACGTGSIASALIASRLWKVSSPVEVIPASGATLEVSFRVKGSEYSNVVLRGQAVTTFTGEFDVEG
ncbi:MAG TPA: diaminopimelate epimerase [Bacteroidota bacterium]